MYKDISIGPFDTCALKKVETFTVGDVGMKNCIIWIKIDGVTILENCDDLNADLNLTDQDRDGVTNCDGDCNDNDVNIQYGVATGLNPYCANTDCQSLLEQGLGTEDGLYWIAPYDVDPTKVYCDMTTEGGGWMMFGDVVSTTILVVPIRLLLDV